MRSITQKARKIGTLITNALVAITVIIVKDQRKLRR